MRRNALWKRLAALVGLFFILLNYPLLEIYQHGGNILGLPRFYFSMFLIWGTFIGLVAWLVEGKRGKS